MLERGTVMRGKELDSLCREVGTGEEKFVQNLDSMYTGKVLSCRGDELVVEAFGHFAEWPAARCRPVSRDVNHLGPETSL